MKNPPFSVKRRRFLAGASTLLALPVLETLQPRQAKAAETKPPQRLVVVHTTCGVKMDAWTPAQTGSNFTLSPTLASLSKVQKNVLVLSNMRNDAAVQSLAAAYDPQGAVGRHALGLATLFTGAKIAISANNASPKAQALPSMDQIYAKSLAGQVQPSLQLALPKNAYDLNDGDNFINSQVMLKISWSDAQTLLDEAEDPAAVFKQYFAGSKDSTTSQTLDAQRARRKSVLDNVLAQANDLQGKLSRNDQRKLDQYFTSVRELEVQLDTLSNFSCAQAAEPGASAANDYLARADAMMDIMALAFQCDLTRTLSFNFGVGHSTNVYNFLDGVSTQTHFMSHSRDNAGWKDGAGKTYDQAGLDAMKVKVEAWEISRLARFFERLQAIPEATGTALDNSVTLIGSEIADSNAHDYANTGYLVVGGAGGAITTGRHVRAGTATANGNLTELQLAILQALAVPVSSFGGFETTRAMTLKV